MEKGITEINSAWDTRLARYILKGIEHLEKQSNQATYYLHLIAEKTGLPCSLIASPVSGMSDDIKRAKILYSWILEEKVDLSPFEIVYFVGEQENTVRYFIERHLYLMKVKQIDQEGVAYFAICEKIFPGCGKTKKFPKVTHDHSFDVVLKIEPRPFKDTQKSEIFVAQFVFEVITESMGITKERLLIKSRITELVWGRHIFMAIMKSFFPDISLSSIGLYLDGRDHATVLYGLRQHSSRLESKDHEYLSMYVPIYKKCRKDAPIGSSDFPCTVEGICNFLSEKQVSFNQIRMVKESLTAKLQTSYVFSIAEISQVFARIGITEI